MRWRRRVWFGEQAGWSEGAKSPNEEREDRGVPVTAAIRGGEGMRRARGGEESCDERLRLLGETGHGRPRYSFPNLARHHSLHEDNVTIRHYCIRRRLSWTNLQLIISL